MADQAKLREVFSDQAYVESLVKLSAEDAAKSLNEKGVDVTAEELMQIHDFIVAHQEELQSGEVSEEKLAEIAGGSAVKWILTGFVSALAVAGATAMFIW